MGHQKRQLSVSFSCYPFSLTRFGVTQIHKTSDCGSQIPEPLRILTWTCPLKVQISQGLGPFFHVKLLWKLALGALKGSTGCLGGLGSQLGENIRCGYPFAFALADAVQVQVRGFLWGSIAGTHGSFPIGLISNLGSFLIGLSSNCIPSSWFAELEMSSGKTTPGWTSWRRIRNEPCTWNRKRRQPHKS